MKALKIIYAIIIGALGGIIGSCALALLFILNAFITIGEELWRAIVNRKS